jgi:GNAT superfamily N-acetyltransferase
MSAVRIRDADLTRDKLALLEFIMDLQRHEHVFEANRRLDPPVADEYLRNLLKDVAEHDGKIFVAADESDNAVGWVVVHESDDSIYVVSEERHYVYISELYVNQSVRGAGIGRALIAACEDLARSRGIGVMQIGVVPGNVRAHAIYRQAGYADYGIQLRKYLR